MAGGARGRIHRGKCEATKRQIGVGRSTVYHYWLHCEHVEGLRCQVSHSLLRWLDCVLPAEGPKMVLTTILARLRDQDTCILTKRRPQHAVNNILEQRTSFSLALWSLRSVGQLINSTRKALALEASKSVPSVRLGDIEAPLPLFWSRLEALLGRLHASNMQLHYSCFIFDLSNLTLPRHTLGIIK